MTMVRLCNWIRASLKQRKRNMTFPCPLEAVNNEQFFLHCYRIAALRLDHLPKTRWSLHDLSCGNRAGRYLGVTIHKFYGHGFGADNFPTRQPTSGEFSLRAAACLCHSAQHVASSNQQMAVDASRRQEY